MRDFTQKFNTVPFFLQRIIGSGFPLDFYAVGFDFKGLLHLRRKDDFAFYHYRAAYVELCDFFKVGYSSLLENNLHAFKAAAVVKLDKTENLAVPYCSYPARHDHVLVGVNPGLAV